MTLDEQIEWLKQNTENTTEKRRKSKQMTPKDIFIAHLITNLFNFIVILGILAIIILVHLWRK